MEKIQLHNLLDGKSSFYAEGNGTIILLLSNGKILKFYEPSYLDGIHARQLEKKVLLADKFDLPKEIIKPEAAVYSGNLFTAVLMEKAEGISYPRWLTNLLISGQEDLYKHAEMYLKLESLVKSSDKIVFPDLCTATNIFVSEGNLQMIDYDGIQIDKWISDSISSGLGPIAQYQTSKKYRNKKLFTKELDKKSLIFFYLSTALNIDLLSITSREILEQTLRNHGLDDEDILEKADKIFCEDQSNEYLGEDVYQIAEKYRLETIPSKHTNLFHWQKRLVKKP